jgi:hypothetical protein
LYRYAADKELWERDLVTFEDAMDIFDEVGAVQVECS